MVLSLDPTMRDLLLLTPKDLEIFATIDKELSEALEKMRAQLLERGELTYRQLRYAASILAQLDK